MNKRAKKQKAIIFVIVLILALIFVYPLFLIVMNSVKPLAQILTKPLSWPDVFQIENYVKAFKEVNVLHVMKNTAVLTIGSVAGITLLAAMTAYWTFRYQTKYSKIFETFVILSMLIPFASLMLPLVQVMKVLGLNNSMFGTILTYWGIGLAFAFFMMQSAVKGLPVELEESARIDGCSRTRIFFSIIIPLLKPTMVSVVLMDMFWIWNDFMVPLIMMNNERLMTIQLSISRLFGQYASKWDIALPALVMTILPIVIVFILLQKKIMDGVIAGAVKG